nr:hypothetical protein [Tanacetum cinerariifolium]
SSYESLPSLSSPDLLSRKRYQGTSELVEDSEDDVDEEDEEIEESLDSDSGLIAGVEGPGTDDERHGMDDESCGLNDEGHSVESDVLSLAEGEEAIPGGQQQAALVVRTAVTAPLGLGYGALRRRELALEEDYVYNMFKVGQAGSSSRDAGGLIYDHVVRLDELSPALFERYDRDIGELFTRSRAVRDEMLSQRYRFRSLEHEHEHERTAMTFGALWRPMMALEAWAGHRFAARAVGDERSCYCVGAGEGP